VLHVLCTLTPWPNTTCKLLNTSLLVYCQGYFANMPGWLIPDEFNETEVDYLAWVASTDQKSQLCPVFDINFECARHFPLCMNDTGVVYVMGMCTTSCLEAEQDDQALCQNLDISTICTDPSFFDTPPDCLEFTMNLPQPSTTWKIVLIVVLSVVAFLILASLAVGYIRAKLWNPNRDPHDFEDERREAERQQKEKEKAHKQGEAYADLDNARAVEEGAPGPRRWTSAQEAREAALARTKQAEADRAAATEMVEFPNDETVEEGVVQVDDAKKA